jgi:hypothetical protein
MPQPNVLLLIQSFLPFSPLSSLSPKFSYPDMPLESSMGSDVEELRAAAGKLELHQRGEEHVINNKAKNWDPAKTLTCGEPYSRHRFSS